MEENYIYSRKCEKAVLTIGIPTYNRPQQIVEQVKRLLPQLNDRVKLVVYDNCSLTPVKTLFTEDELEKFMIICNKLNIGGDANIASVIYNCDTEWVWTLGDDDYISDNAVVKILNVIDNNKDCTYINFNSPIEAVTNNFEEFVSLFKYRLVFAYSFWISNCVFNRREFGNDIRYYYENISTNIGQLIMVLKHLEKKDCKCIFTRNKTIEQVNSASTDESGITWSTKDFIVRSSLVYYLFHDKKSFLKKNLFKALASENFTFVYNSKMSLSEKFYLYKKILRDNGIFNFIFYNSTTIFHRIIKSLMPKSLYSYLVDRYSNNFQKYW